MARMHQIKSSRKEHTCGGCRRTIQKGESYRRWRVNFGADVIRCSDCPSPPRSHFTRSEILGTAYDLADGVDFSSVEDRESLEHEMQTHGENIREIAEIIQEKMDNIESGMGHTEVPVYQELEERKYMYEDWADQCEQFDASDEELSLEELIEAAMELAQDSPE